ncbi:hypothetical protein G6L37_03215 [Agrobacterium rubi]|nr:hypothetical protein [Agrobacterium rubi]NTF24385.1 hypothetical protein [Agrobacterium rubi]
MSDFQGDANGASGFFKPDFIPEADVLVIAGDFCPPLHRSISSLSKISFLMPVVYVPGNRDFYTRSTMEDELELARQFARAPQGKGIHILDDQSVVVAGTRFIGATLWTDLEFDGGLSNAALGMSDFSEITTGSGTFSPSEFRRRHKASRAFIEDTLAMPFDGPSVVVSHHSPHPNSVGARFADNRNGANALFHSDLSEILEGPSAPDMWVHGATHVSADYVVGQTRILNNPLGYGRGSENEDFIPDLVVELSAPSYLPSY